MEIEIKSIPVKYLTFGELNQGDLFVTKGYDDDDGPVVNDVFMKVFNSNQVNEPQYIGLNIVTMSLCLIPGPHPVVKVKQVSPLQVEVV